LLHDDAVGSQFLCDCVGRPAANLVALDGEHVAHQVPGRDLPKDARHYRSDDLFGQRLRQVGMDVVELARVDAIADADREADFQPFFGLRLERLGFGGEQMIARLV
jgi:hypothetical protein